MSSKLLRAQKDSGKLLPLPLPQPQPQPQPECSSNSVGKLQELCQKQLRPLPRYAFECTGSDHPALRKFICIASVGDSALTGRGVGRSKRLAKHLAADVLLRQLLLENPSAMTSRPPPPTTLPTAAPIEEATFQRLRVSKRLQSAARAGAEVGAVFNGVVRNRKAGAALPTLTPPVASSGSACEQLMELGRMHKFGVQFLDDKALGGGSTDRHRSVVKLCTMPTIVVVGNGADVAASREEASRAAMDYLCLLTRDSMAGSKK